MKRLWRYCVAAHNFRACSGTAGYAEKNFVCEQMGDTRPKGAKYDVFAQATCDGR